MTSNIDHHLVFGKCIPFIPDLKKTNKKKTCYQNYYRISLKNCIKFLLLIAPSVSNLKFSIKAVKSIQNISGKKIIGNF